MKKCLSIMIVAILLVFSTSAVAFAEETSAVISPTPAPMYHVTYDLVKTESSNMTVVAKPDASYRTTVKPANGYRLERVQILMSGVDITDSVYDVNTGVVYIPVITGDIEVIAKSVKDVNPTSPTDKTTPTGTTDKTSPTDTTDETTPTDTTDVTGSTDTTDVTDATDSTDVTDATDSTDATTPGGNTDNGGNGTNGSNTSPVTGDSVVLFGLLALALAGGSVFAYKKVKNSK